MQKSIFWKDNFVVDPVGLKTESRLKQRPTTLVPTNLLLGILTRCQHCWLCGLCVLFTNSMMFIGIMNEVKIPAGVDDRQWGVDGDITGVSWGHHSWNKGQIFRGKKKNLKIIIQSFCETKQQKLCSFWFLLASPQNVCPICAASLSHHTLCMGNLVWFQ